jgi:6-phosphogluconolactonase
MLKEESLVGNYLHIYKSLDKLSVAAAGNIVNYANQAIVSRGVFRIALVGGSTPRDLYRVLSSKKYINKTDWSKWVVYFSDERIVPLDDERSNYAMIKETLLNGQIKEENVYAVPVHIGEPARVAAQYEARIRNSFKETSESPPRFDVVLLGLGSDGHTASLFPGKVTLKEGKRIVVESTPGVLPPSVDRVTFTLPLINAARQVMFLASGRDKSKSFQAAYYGVKLGDSIAPAHLVQPTNGGIGWFVTEELM